METPLHNPALTGRQCGSKVSQMIHAPLPVIWSMVRQFDNPQAYKQFIRSCDLISGYGGAGSVRELKVVSGLPGESSTERLDRLDDDLHVVVFSISTTSLHEEDDGGGVGTVVVDIPADSCREDTCLFADMIIGCNLKSLANVAEKMACCV
ncbi:hypothetical protein ACP275_13G170700 [Erythranthe tilingii]